MSKPSLTNCPPSSPPWRCSRVLCDAVCALGLLLLRGAVADKSLFLRTCQSHTGERVLFRKFRMRAAAFPERNTSGGYSRGVPPLPIPNREVKPARADGTAPQCGRVGRRLFSQNRKHPIEGCFLRLWRIGIFGGNRIFWILQISIDILYLMVSQFNIVIIDKN